MKKCLMLGLVFVSMEIFAESRPIPKLTDEVAYVYVDAGSRLNHYIPSGWMGDFGDLKVGTNVKEGAYKGASIKIQYSAERKQGAGWTGIYWQMPANNWGDKKGGYDLSKYKTLSFMARGVKGGEVIDKFMIGGITGQMEEGDSDGADTGQVELTKQWKRYEINLDKKDLTHIIGGFGFVLNSDTNPGGATFYIDEIKFDSAIQKAEVSTIEKAN